MFRFKLLLANFLWVTGLLRLAGKVRCILKGPRLIVLCYHRIDSNLGIPALSASPVEFCKQLTWYTRRFDRLSLYQVSKFLSQKTLNRDAIALTFDDGYSDNFETVYPLLQKYKMPAAFFIATGPLIHRTPYWYDSIWVYLHHWNGNIFPHELISMLPKDLLLAIEKFKSSRQKDHQQKVLDLTKGLSIVSRNHLLNVLKDQQDSLSLTPICQTMTVNQAKAMEENGFLIGGHTQTHPSLARIPESECKSEIINGLVELRKENFPAKYFAYPFGESVDVGGIIGYPYHVLTENDETKTSSSGVELSFTTEERAMRKDENPFLIPRKVIMPQSLPQIAFKLELLAWRK